MPKGVLFKNWFSESQTNQHKMLIECLLWI